MRVVDEIEDINDLIIELKAKLSKDKNNKDLLIRESFVLWYALVEGVKCENFTETELNELLVQNYNQYKKFFLNDVDYDFIIGWMLSVAFWYFNDLNDNDGRKILMNVYKRKSENFLFKWAVRGDLNLNKDEISHLCKSIGSDFYKFYNYGPFIKRYFLDLIKVR
ncbi:MAG TPA: hypothetical protein PKE07_00010 [Lacibacter sp.]|nr:hypothetical protein [Lacibacter sp.]HMO88320.1 hypothetical protein [Lacibacter sp.]